MILNRLISKIAAFLVVIFVFTGCDEDYSSVGGSVIDNPSDVLLEEVPVTAFSHKINAVQTNNLSSYSLGVYNDPVYGQSVGSILTQLSLTNTSPSFGDNAKLDSVVLHLPYYSRETDVDDNGAVLYELDSVYGNKPFKISIITSNYFLRELDPDADFQNSQKYYSNQQPEFEQFLGQVLYEEDNFRPSSSRIVNFEPAGIIGDVDTTSMAPALRVKLPVSYFQRKIIDKEGSVELTNNNNFHDYLRGLFIKAEPVNNDGSLILFNLNDPNAKISLYYTYDSSSDSENEIHDKFDLAINSSSATTTKVNTFEGDFKEEILQDIQNEDTLSGSEALYLKGQEGSMAVVKLFENQAQLDSLRQKNWLINEANLTFYVDQSKLNGNEPAQRLYLYNLDDNTILQDYALASYTLNPITSVLDFSEVLDRDENETGVSYTINITQHVNNILNEDADNVRLGLVVMQNINAAVQRGQNDIISSVNRSGLKDDEVAETLPSPTIFTPKGTVLYGNAAPEDDKKLKLQIYYTEINQ